MADSTQLHHSISKKLIRILLAGVGILIATSFFWGVYLFRSMIGIEKSLPVNTLNQYEFLASTESLLYKMRQDIHELSVQSDQYAVGKLKITIARTNSVLSQLEYDDMELPEVLDPIFFELKKIMSDISLLSDEELGSDDFKSVLFRNRLEYVISEWRNYILQLNRESLHRLDTQSLRMISLRNQLGVTFVIFIISFVTMIILLGNQTRMLQYLEKANIKIESANKAKSSFLANMSHEIRTPLNAIMGLTYLTTQTRLDHQQLNYLKKINSSAESLLTVINDILDFSKIEAGKLSMESTEFYLEDVLNKVADIISLKADEKGLEFILNIEDGTPDELVGDPLRLRQILLNLVSNAIKFTEVGEVLIDVKLLRTEETDVVLQFEVKDTGIGLSDDQIENLFKAFNQADTSITRKYGGTGLGLVICKRLVNMMRGEINLESELGKGSVFSFTAAFGRHENKRPLPKMWAEDFRNMRALVIDDSKTARTAIKRILESIKLEVTTASSGKEALAILEMESENNRDFDMVFTDQKMPLMDGIETAHRIREIQSLSRIPVIIMITAYGMDDIIEKAFNAGLDGFITKPVSPSTILDCIMTAFGKEKSFNNKKALNIIKDKKGINSLEGAKVLLAEDNDVNQLVAKELLKSIGIEVTIADNGLEALDLLKEKSFDALLMDVQMPVMDGISATKRIRELKTDYSQIPIIALTAHAMAGDREKSLSAGMNDHITKPLDPEELFNVLFKWIRSGSSEPRGKDFSSREIESSDLPGFSGFDADGALRRVGGNREALYRLMINFKEGYSDKLSIIAELLKSGNQESAKQKIHAYKGVAGNIGAVDLHNILKQLEHNVVNIEGIELSELLGKAERCHKQTIESIDTLLTAYEQDRISADGEETTAEESEYSIRESLFELKSLLESNSFGAGESLRSMEKQLEGFDVKTEVSSLNKLVGKYQFKDAVAVVDEILEKINQIRQ